MQPSNTPQTRFIIRYSVALLLVFTGKAFAAEQETAMESMVVSATRTESSIKETSAAVTVITGEEIEAKGATRLKDILRFSTGLYFPQDDAVSIRGMNPNQTLFLINGKRFTGEVDGQFEINRLPVNNIEKIEIVRGPVSALYGTDALGGVINIITTKPDELRFAIDTQYGVFTEDSDGDQKNITLNADVPFSEKYAASFSGAWRDYGRLDNSRNESIQKEGDEKTFGLDFFYDLSDSNTIVLRGDYMDEEGDNFANRNMIKMTDDNQRQNYSLSWKHNSDSFESEIQAYTSIYDKDFEVRHNWMNKLLKFIDAERTTSVLEGHGTTMFATHRVTGGAEVRQETFKGNVLHTGEDAYRVSREGVSYVGSGIDINYYAAYLQDEWLLTDDLSLIGAVRYDDSDAFDNEISPKIGFVYRFLEDNDSGLRLKANYGHGFKTPTPADLYLETVLHDKKMMLLPNENVGAETSESFDISLEGDIGKVSGKISYFQNDVDDLIDRVFSGRKDPVTGYKIFHSENIRKAAIKGFEAEIGYSFLENAGLHASYMYLDARGDTLVGPPPMKMFKEKRLEQRPESRITFRTWYNHNPWGLKLNLWGEYTGGMLLNYERDKMNNITGENTKDYWVWYANISKAIGENMELYGGVNNIFDKKDDDIPLYGTFVFAGIRVAF